LWKGQPSGRTPGGSPTNRPDPGFHGLIAVAGRFCLYGHDRGSPPGSRREPRCDSHRFLHMRQKPSSKKTAAPSDPITLGQMRELGVRSLYITCSACGYASTVNVDDWQDDVLIEPFGPSVKCAKWGHLGGVVRPDWSGLRGGAGDRGH
jgi:hypothetical protein